MNAPVYRPETYEADMVLAVRDLLGHAREIAEAMPGGETPAFGALVDAHNAVEDLCGVATIAAIDEAPDDPVRSVRAAIALLWIADADGPGEGWGDVAEGLERRLWARGPVVDADDVARDDHGRIWLRDCEGPGSSCDCVGVADDGTPYGCVLVPGHTEHHRSPDGWRWRAWGPDGALVVCRDEVA